MSNAITATQFFERGYKPSQFYRNDGGVGDINAFAFPDTGGHVLKSSSTSTSTNNNNNNVSNSSDNSNDASSSTRNLVTDFNILIVHNTDVTDNKTREITNIPSPVRSTQNYYSMTDKYHREDERLKTFQLWPLEEWLDKFILARTGMYFVGDYDKVKCYFCEVEIGRWERDDQPVPEHLRWSPNCPLLRRRTTNNVPINADALDQILPPPSYDVCGSNDSIDIRPRSYAESAISSGCMPPPLNLSAASNQPAYYPEFPEYAIEAARVRSFNEWPQLMKQRPEQLAEAGFYYTGIGDRVKCFSCGGGLKDWNVNDDPWEQHAMWMPTCRYLKLIKGQQFIDEAIAKKKLNDAEQKKKEDAAKAAAELEANQSASEVAATAGIENQITTAQPSAQQQSETTFCGNAMSAMCAITTTTTNTNESVAMQNASNDTITTQPQLGATGAAGCGDVRPTVAAANVNAACDNRVDLIVSSDNCKTTTAAVKPTTNTTNIPEDKLCKICYAAEYNTAFLPCGHVVACAKCASSVTKCPLCRKPFTDVMRVYFS